ncbi:hypothetical protein SLS62_008268 [Diatrype stigma]|uniref:Short-chain dehydrogenase n=1 Tax=Diatrype stigma TaxID=117547 RepID=A0AAN9YP52_9PEZI
MPFTTHPEFNANTEALEVAKAFADGIRGKTVIVTGVNRGGIGFTTAQAFASQSPANLILTGRNPAKVQESIDALKAEYPGVNYRSLKIDLSSQKAVRAAAAEVLAWSDIPAVDILVNSAGVMGIQERTLSEDGIEMHFATNHIGHWLFTCLIAPKLIAAAAAQRGPKGATRVVNVSSGSPYVTRMRWSDRNFEKRNGDLPALEQPPYDFLRAWGFEDLENQSYNPVEAYSQSKVANVLAGVGATRRLLDSHGILSLALHPGVIKTELGRSFPEVTLSAIKTLADAGNITYKTQGAGASTSLVAALDPGLAVGVGETKDGKENYGAFLENCQISEQCLPETVSNAEAEKLWKLSEELVHESFSW